MNIKKIPITDNAEEQFQIGRELASVYSDDMIRSVKKTIDKLWNESCGHTKTELLYRSVYDYWVYGFTADQEIYYKLADKTHTEKDNYLTYHNKWLYFDRLNLRENMHMLENKYEAYELMKPYYKREIIKIENESDYSAFLDFVGRHSSFVAKPLGLSCAAGVQKMDASDYPDIKTMFLAALRIGSDCEGEYKFKGCPKGAVVLEEMIIQDPEIAKIHPWSINGVRITTIRIGDKVHIYYPWLKLGCHKEFISSAAIGSMDAGIDSVTGVINTDGCTEDGNFLVYQPDTNIRIKGFVIPKWQELVDMATELANFLPSSINYVGWDFALTPTGWCVMEANYYGNVMWQMFLGKGMKHEFEELIGWKPDKKFWWQYGAPKF